MLEERLLERLNRERLLGVGVGVGRLRLPLLLLPLLDGRLVREVRDARHKVVRRERDDALHLHVRRAEARARQKVVDDLVRDRRPHVRHALHKPLHLRAVHARAHRRPVCRCRRHLPSLPSGFFFHENNHSLLHSLTQTQKKQNT